MIDADHFRERVAQDAIAEATAEYWERRAKAFRAVGTEKADEIAQSCVNRAALERAEWAEHDAGRNPMRRLRHPHVAVELLLRGHPRARPGGV